VMRHCSVKKDTLNITPSLSKNNEMPSSTPFQTAPDKFEEYRMKVAGTNIDSRSLLSTDYFNNFNSVVMLFDMLPEAPELLDEIDEWKFNTYVEHFQNSGLDFAVLAIEAYDYVPLDMKRAFERKIEAMRVFIVDCAQTLRHLHEAGETQAFATFARQAAEMFRFMMNEGGAIIHGTDASLDQGAIDKMF
ncbi:MAG: hypothetical protein KGI97_07085, partial [Alphaproteobacteria bacterium]|nr:hypothetical protein [Alphaproteobacteria bacterium]